MAHLKLRDDKGRLISYLTDEERKQNKKNVRIYNSDKYKLYNAKYKERTKEWRVKNKELLKEKKKIYYQNNKEKFKKYYIENKEKLNKINKEWALKNKGEKKFCSACSKNKTLDCFGTHKRTKDGKYYKCKDCVKLYNQSERRKQYQKEYQKYDNRKEYLSKYTKDNTFLQYQREFRKRPHIKAKRIILQKKQRDTLIPSYVKQKLKQQGFKKEYLDKHPELVETQREIIKIKRLCRI